MEFLYELYSNNYFGIGLFIVITVLTFSFLVVLFFGKKDEKNRANLAAENKPVDEAPTQNNDLQAVSITMNENQSDTNLNNINDLNNVNNVNNINNSNGDVPITPNVNTPDLNSVNFQNNINEPSLENIKQEETQNIVNETIQSKPEENVFDINSLSDNVINNSSVTPNIKEQVEIKPNPFNEEIKKDESNNTFVNPFSEKKAATSQFSSVYVDKKEEAIAANNMVKPTFDLPKKAELPKKATNSNNMFNTESLSKEKSNSTSMFKY